MIPLDKLQILSHQTKLHLTHSIFYSPYIFLLMEDHFIATRHTTPHNRKVQLARSVKAVCTLDTVVSC